MIIINIAIMMILIIIVEHEKDLRLDETESLTFPLSHVLPLSLLSHEIAHHHVIIIIIIITRPRPPSADDAY